MSASQLHNLDIATDMHFAQPTARTGRHLPQESDPSAERRGESLFRRAEGEPGMVAGVFRCERPALHGCVLLG